MWAGARGAAGVSATRAVGYLRVSTDDQSVDLQRTAIQRYARRRGWKLGALYTDQGVSGLRGRRPALDQLMAAARRKHFDAVIVWKFDRFARDVRDLLGSLETFQALGIDFVSETEGIDTSTAMGEMVMTFLGAVAKFEASLIRERVRAGVRAKMAAGGPWGRRPTLGPLIVARARRLLSRRRGLRTIARQLKVPRTTLRRALGLRTGSKG